MDCSFALQANSSGFWTSGFEIRNHTWIWSSTGKDLIWDGWTPGEPGSVGTDNHIYLNPGRNFTFGSQESAYQHTPLCEMSKSSHS